MTSKSWLAGALLGAPLVFLSAGANAAPTFPAIGSSTGGPAIVFTFTDTGINTQILSAQTYDGTEDVEVGLVNNSSVTQTTLALAGANIFGFDGDGITGYTDANTGILTPGNPADPTGYAGPGVTFSTTSASAGNVNFSLAPGGFAYFGLEGSPGSITSSGGITVGGGTSVPEPASMLLVASGLIGLGLRRRRS